MNDITSKQGKLNFGDEMHVQRMFVADPGMKQTLYRVYPNYDVVKGRHSVGIWQIVENCDRES